MLKPKWMGLDGERWKMCTVWCVYIYMCVCHYHLVYSSAFDVAAATAAAVHHVLCIATAAAGGVIKAPAYQQMASPKSKWSMIGYFISTILRVSSFKLMLRFCFHSGRVLVQQYKLNFSA